jgi:hypothetical protein
MSLVLAGAVGNLACGPSDLGDGGDGGTGDVDAPVNGPDSGPPADAWQSPPDASCGDQTVPIELTNLGEPPDMLIVLDRSGSMTDVLDPFVFPWEFKWDVMKAALISITEATETNIRYGLAAFPTDDDCAVAAGAVVPIDLEQHAAIEAWLEDGSNAPNGNTPAHLGLENALAIYNGITPNPDGRYVLFATDGVPNCGDSDPYPLTLAAVNALSSAGINTFVLGFGGITALDDDLLNDAAQAGGVPKPGGPPHYYHADDPAELQTALEEIMGGIIQPSCSYELAEPPPDPNDVSVTIDGVPVPRSPGHNDGWDYHPDANTITFFGSYCDDIMNGSVGEVSFVYGCPGPVVP